MDNQEQDKLIIEVIPVIEVDIKSYDLKSKSKEGLFASKYLELGKTGKFLESPDGWFFPLDNLLKDIQSYANFLLLENSKDEEFEICGGFQILIDGELIPSVSIGSSFLFAMNIANWVVNQEKDKSQIFNIDNDKTLSFGFEKNEIAISFFQGKKREIKIPSIEFKEKCKYAQKLTKDFAEAITPLIVNHGNKKITPEIVDYEFGLI